MKRRFAVTYYVDVEFSKSREGEVRDEIKKTVPVHTCNSSTSRSGQIFVNYAQGSEVIIKELGKG